MHKPVRFVVRFLVLAAVTATLPMMVTQPPGHSPYLSALSDLAAPSASAAPTCNNKMCTAGPRISFKCVSSTGWNCQSDHFDCSNSPC
jgi:hypothetical protein